MRCGPTADQPAICGCLQEMAVSAFWALMYFIGGIIAAAGADRMAKDLKSHERSLKNTQDPITVADLQYRIDGEKSNRDCFGAGAVSFFLIIFFVI